MRLAHVDGVVRRVAASHRASIAPALKARAIILQSRILTTFGPLLRYASNRANRARVSSRQHWEIHLVGNNDSAPFPMHMLAHIQRSKGQGSPAPPQPITSPGLPPLTGNIVQLPTRHPVTLPRAEEPGVCEASSATSSALTTARLGASSAAALIPHPSRETPERRREVSERPVGTRGCSRSAAPNSSMLNTP